MSNLPFKRAISRQIEGKRNKIEPRSAPKRTKWVSLLEITGLSRKTPYPGKACIIF
jgi:hypothetical protein